MRLIDAATTRRHLAFAPLIDGDKITSRRTAAASALAASLLARADARRLLIVGAGRVASLLAPALRAVRPIDTVQVWNHRSAPAHALAARLRDEGFDAVERESLSCTASPAPDPSP